MARLESESKGGYYPIPPEEMALILKMLRLSDEAIEQGITLLDACAGEGEALKQMADYFKAQTSVTTYGIELEKSRAEKAATKLDHVLACGYEETRMSHEAFSVLYLNPPYAEYNGKRIEQMFVDDLTKDHLSTGGGLLILIIPQYVLRSVAKVLASRFSKIRVYRFTEKNYDAFKQVVVIGERRERGLRSAKEQSYKERIEQDLIDMSYSKDLVSPLDQVSKLGVTYEIKPSLKPVQLFKNMQVDPAQIVASAINCNHSIGVLGKMQSLEISTTNQNLRPALPLKTTHIATSISSGVLPESMGSHLLVGVTKQVQEKSTSYNQKSDKMSEITTFKSKSIVRIFSEKGVFTLK